MGSGSGKNSGVLVLIFWLAHPAANQMALKSIIDGKFSVSTFVFHCLNILNILFYRVE